MTSSPPVSSFSTRWALPILLVGVVAIAFSPILVRLSEVGPVATAVNRLLLPLPLFWIALLRQPDHRWTARRVAIPLALVGAFFAGDLIFWHWSLKLTAIADATFINNLSPVLVIAGAWLLFKQRVGKLFLIGAGISMLGMGLFVAHGMGSHSTLTGDLLALVAALFYAAYLLTVARVRRHASSAALIAISGTVGVAILIPIALVMEPALFPSTTHGWLMAFALAFLVQALGQGLLIFALAHVSPSLGSLMLLLQPVGAAVFAWMIFDEAITLQQGIGGLAILAGIAIAHRDGAARQASEL